MNFDRSQIVGPYTCVAVTTGKNYSPPHFTVIQRQTLSIQKNRRAVSSLIFFRNFDVVDQVRISDWQTHQRPDPTGNLCVEKLANASIFFQCERRKGVKCPVHRAQRQHTCMLYCYCNRLNRSFHGDKDAQRCTLCSAQRHLGNAMESPGAPTAAATSKVRRETLVQPRGSTAATRTRDKIPPCARARAHMLQRAVPCQEGIFAQPTSYQVQNKLRL